MENQNFIGIGCYAKPAKLSRVFKKLVQDYTLGPFERNQLFDGPASKEIKGVELLQALVAGRRPAIISRGSEGYSFKSSPIITGFYLTLDDQGLNLSIFARSKNRQREIITTSLDGLTKLRQKRLH